MRAVSLRGLAALLAVAMIIPVAGPAFAATPAHGQLTDQQRTRTYTGGPFTAPNPTDPLGDGTTLQCMPVALPCDEFALTVVLASNYLAAHPDARVRVALGSNNGKSDYDLYVLDEGGNYVAVGYNSGPKESVEFAVLGGTHRYTIRAVPFSSEAGAYTAQLSLLAANPAVDTDKDGVPDIKDQCPSTPAGTKADHGSW